MQSSLELPAAPSAPYWARRLAFASLGAWRISADVIDTASLLVSELVTNAVRVTMQMAMTHDPHSEISPASILLTMRHLAGVVTIEVFDQHHSPPVLVAPDDDDENGRGLMLVQALSKEWGHYFPPAGGKTVYCIIENR